MEFLLIERSPNLSSGFRAIHDGMIVSLKNICNNSSTEIVVAKESLIVLKKTIGELREYLMQNPPVSEKEEILFFKEIKPAFYCYWEFYSDVLNMETLKPVGNADILKTYYENHLHKLNYFFERHTEFWIYFRKGATLYDKVYFTRRVVDQSIYHEGFSLDLDRTFSTSHDYLVSRILANELLSQFINSQLLNLGNQGNKREARNTGISWTAQKIGFAELLYAFYASGVINNSQIDIKKLNDKLSACFNIDISNIYKKFEEIRMRKKNRTVFLDSLRLNLLRKMDEDDEHAL